MSENMVTHFRVLVRLMRGEATKPAERPTRCPVMRTVRALRDFQQRAFTLVELLVVIAVVALLVSILLPTLGRARLMGRQTRELAGGKQLMTAFTLYANDNKDRVLTGYPSAQWVATTMPVYNGEGERLYAEQAQRYPWRIAPYFDGDFRGLYLDQKMLKDVRDNAPTYTPLGVNLDYVISLFPSLGMNINFVGGSDRLGQFDPLFRQVFGRPYVERLDEVRRPSDLIAFASARAEAQPLAPQLGTPDGFFRVEPPLFSAGQPRQWEASYDPRSAAPGQNSGFVALRYGGSGDGGGGGGGKAVSAQVDGHCAMLGWEDLNDMRRWADGADRADWVMTPR